MVRPFRFAIQTGPFNEPQALREHAKRVEDLGIVLRPPGPRVTRFGESVQALRSLLDVGSANFVGEHITVAVDELGVRPAQQRVPILIGGHGKRVVTIAAKRADVFQFTGLTHDPVTGQPSAGGFARADVADRHAWVSSTAGARYPELELSTLVQQTHISDKPGKTRADAAVRLDADPSFVDETPFILIGSKNQIIEKLQALRKDFGIHHVVSRDPDDLAPIVSELAGQ